MSTFPVRLDVEFTDEDVDINIFLSGAFSWEWWIETEYYDFGLRYVVQGNDGNGNKGGFIEFDDIRRVMGNICADAYPNPEYYTLAKKQIMDGIRTGDWDFDACGADEIIQIAVFGKVVYS